MIRSYLRGLRGAAARWPLAVVLWLIGLVFGTAFAFAAAFWLADALDASLATRTLVSDLDPHVFVDLYFHHWEGSRMLLPLAIALAVVYVVLWAWLHGAIVHSVRAREASLGEAFRRGLEVGAVYARLLLLAMLLLIGFSTAIGWSAWTARSWTAEGSTALLPDLVLAAGATIWLIGYVFLTAVHDHARIRVVASGHGALAAYGWAWAFVARGGERAFVFALVLQLIGLALWAGFQFVSLSFSAGAVLGVAWSLVWGELFLLLRMLVRIWFFAAQSELQ